MSLAARATVSPHDIAVALAGDGPVRAPTQEQEAVITADGAPTLVVAGAGSGKTETMSMRVLWLLANGFAEPDDILGLTFTKKAAGELHRRLLDRIAQLTRAGLVDADRVALAQPQVATYNSFANQIFREHALVIGRDPDAELLQDTAAWVLARDVATHSDDERLAAIGSADQVATALLTLAGQLGDNALSPEAVRGLSERFCALGELPMATADEPRVAARSEGTTRRALEEVLPPVAALEPLLDLAVAFDERKRRLGVVQYSDQVRFALEILRAAPALAAEHRNRASFVLLDEYQDTASVQVELLSTLFRDMAVMAVGDPNQSIYGWRGASAGTLARFHRDFGGTATASLSVSWRNQEAVLDVANRIAGSLPDAGVDELRPRPGAGRGRVLLRHHATQWEEADEIAAWLAAERAADPEATAAVLFRARERMPVFADALARAGVPHRVLGIGGLLAEPEIVDLVSTLRVIAEPNAGNDLLRLLAGSRWRVGLRDLAALLDHARMLATVGLDEAQTQADRGSTEADTAGSIVDALDDLAELGDDARSWERFTEAGRERLRDAARTLRGLRSQASLPLADFVRLVERTMRLDIEAASNPARAPRRTLDAFAGHVEQFASSDGRGSLASLLGWLTYAMQQDELPMPPEAPEPGTVQLLTVHASKGLEWDLVAVPSLAEGTLPGGMKSKRGWLALGEVPYALRGDAGALPVLDWEGARSLRQFRALRTEFEQGLADRHLAEERRLAYVAVTRAAGALRLSTASWVAGLKRVKQPSRFLDEAAEALGQEIDRDELPDENPGNPHHHAIAWPSDPLGARRPAVEAAAAAVRTADPGRASSLTATLDLLLAERERDLAPTPVPARVSASHLKDWLHDPVGAARAVRRPMPQRPFRATRLGTLFHQWVETRAVASGLPEAVDDVEPHDDLVGIDAERLERLKATFLASPYAARRPIATELEIHMPLAGSTVVCKMDAVYADGERSTVVDWKTGALPTSATDLEERQLQLALYRAAYAQHAGVDERLVDAELYFVEHDRVVRPDRILTLEELEDRWRAVRGALESTPAP